MGDLKAGVATNATPEEVRTASSVAVDLVVGVVLVVVAAFGTAPATASQGLGPAPVAAQVLAVAAAAACVGWRRFPQWTFVVVSLLTMTYLAAGFAFGPILLAQLVATYTLASRVPIRPVLRWSGLLGVVLGAAVLIRTQVAGVGDWLDYARVAAWVVVPLAVGIALRVRRRASIEVRDAQLRQMASEERLRMAQDLHDVVGHGLAVIAMQAGVALHVLDRDPAKARKSLEAIRSTSREALDGLRGELAALTGGNRSSEPAPRRPTPALLDLEVLFDRVRAGGLRIDTDIEMPVTLSDAVEGAAFRIVQESLTNVLRHSNSDVARVRIGAQAGVLVVEVVDRGTSLPTAAWSPHPEYDDAEPGRTHGGTGIGGMRARATAVGGTVTAGPRPEGGFAVQAELPIADPTQPASGRAGSDTVPPDRSEGDTR